MEFVMHSHRNGLELVKDSELFNEVKEVLKNISDKDLMEQFSTYKNSMSISKAINDLIRERLVEKGWLKEAPIFQDSEYDNNKETAWRLDFAKENISVEVSFNHGEALAWNLTKPVLASELNHVKKAIQTKFGVIILCTDELKAAGAFDGAVGTYEKAIRYLKPLQNLLTVPIILIGLKAPKSFVIVKKKNGNKNVGYVKLN